MPQKLAKTPRLGWLAAAAFLALAETAGIAAMTSALTTPAQAQFRFEERNPYARGRQQRPPGFFQQLFGPGNFGPAEIERSQPQFDSPRAPPLDFSRAPSPRKPDGTPTTSVMVMGDSMADWLAYGLEEAFADSPEISVVRKSRAQSGLLRYDARNDLDWWRVARDTLANEKVDFVVMMMGINDRQNIRETQAERADKEKKTAKGVKDDKQAKEDQGKTDQAKNDADKKPTDDDQSSIIAAEPQRGASAGTAAFRTERWEQIYTKRIDETIAALKSKGVPVLWVGLPPLRGSRSTAEVGYLNDLYRARAEKAGIVYVDVWDGFVDEAGKFTGQGPDFEGQVRRLRSGDGVHFTKSGARKLAHYAERELRRFMSSRSSPMALPADSPQTSDGPVEPAVRPLAGPVVPLTTSVGSSDELLGGAGNRPVHSDVTATRVLVRGEPVAPPSGRADDFSWPRASDPATAEPLSPTAAAARGEPVAAKPAAKKPAPAPVRPKPAESKPPEPRAAEPKPAGSEPVRPRPANRAQQQQQQQQQQPQRSSGPFGWLR